MTEAGPESLDPGPLPFLRRLMVMVIREERVS